MQFESARWPRLGKYLMGFNSPCTREDGVRWERGGYRVQVLSKDLMEAMEEWRAVAQG